MTIDEGDQPQEYSVPDSFITRQQKVGQAIQAGSYFPLKPSAPENFPVEARHRLINTLLGAATGIQAAHNAGPGYNPIGAAILGGAAGVQVPQEQAATQAALRLKELEATPIGQISPELVQGFQDSHGIDISNIPAGYIHQLSPLFQMGINNKLQLQQEKTKQAEAAAGKKTDLATEKLWEGLNRTVNPTNAPRGSLLGQAGIGNSRADRALKTLSSPKVTPQQIQAVVADYAGIMQGGAPHEIALRQMGYNNLATDWASLMQRITSKPQSVNTPEVLDKLRSMISDIKDVDNQIIANNLDTVEQTHSGLLVRDPERWQNIRNMVIKTTGSSALTPPPASGGGGDLVSAARAELARRGIK